jgi:hypothetical protein
MSRYIKKSVRDIVDNESCFKCSWCGVTLFERHHIHEYSLGGLNSEDNLILLCPNCHTDTHKGAISKIELETRKKELSGKITKSSGNISIAGSPVFIAGGTRYVGGIEKIVVHKNVTYLKIETSNNRLLISLRLYDKEGKLVFWMNRNRWWLENEKVLDFQFSRNTLIIQSDLMDSILHVSINKDEVALKCKMFVSGQLLEFDEEKINIGNSTLKIGTIKGTKNSTAISVG